MDVKFSKDSGSPQQQEGTGEKKSQSSLLVLLLILVGGFGYLYYFTDLIKPQEEQKAAAAVPAPASPAQVVKIPLPARDNEPAKPAEKIPVKAEATAVKTVAAPVVSAPAPPSSPVEQKKSPTVKPVEKKPEAAPAAAKVATIAAPIEKKSAGADKKSAAARENVKKSASSVPAKHDPAVKTHKNISGPWSVVVGNYVLEEVLSADMGRVRKVGFEPIVKPSARKKTTMNRLFLSEFNDRATALATLEKLKQHTSDGFVLEQGGKFAVYAGSYLQGEAARGELERLKAAGYSATLKHAEIAIPSQRLSIGPFPNKNAADNALGKLRGAGIKATLSQK
jgi:cell division septation protein DedD